MLLLPESVVFSAFTITMFSPWSSRLATMLAMRPRTKLEASMIVGGRSVVIWWSSHDFHVGAFRIFLH